MGREKKVANALSCLNDCGDQVCAILSPQLHLFELIKEEMKTSPRLQLLMQQIEAGEFNENWAKKGRLI